MAASAPGGAPGICQCAPSNAAEAAARCFPHPSRSRGTARSPRGPCSERGFAGRSSATNGGAFHYKHFFACSAGRATRRPGRRVGVFEGSVWS